MKHLYIALVCALVCSSATIAGNRFTARGTRHSLPKMTKAHAAATPIWRPATQTDYIYESGEWMELGKVAFTYDIRGNAVGQDITLSEGGFGRVSSTFDEYDQTLSTITTFSEDGSEWVNESKMTYVYDPVLHSYYTERMGYDWSEDAWIQNYYCETNVITRNTAGNITEVVKSLPFADAMIPAYKLVWKYDESTGRAVEMAYYCNYNPEPEWEIYDGVEYKNIVWAATDGQMTDESLEKYLEGSNRIASLDAYYEGELDGHLFVTYTDNGGYTARQTALDPNQNWSVFKKEFTDANGSYVMTRTDYYDEDGYTTEPTYVATQTVKFNEHGDIVSDEMISTEAGETFVEGYKYEYVYDSEGRMTECVTKEYDFDLEDYVNTEKTVYGEYLDAVAGIEGVSVDAAEAEYYDLNGRRVADPAAGQLYIKRQGTRVTKVIL